MSNGLLSGTGIRGFWSSLLRGLACPVEIFASPRIRLPYRSDADALRADWKNIGRDFRKAMSYERDALAGNR